MRPKPNLLGQYGLIVASSKDADTLSELVTQIIADPRLSLSEKNSLIFLADRVYDNL